MARGKGEGSVYKRSDGMWCSSIELPPGPGGKRRRKVVSRKSKAEVVKIMRDHQKQLQSAGNIASASPRLDKWMTYWLEEIAAPKLRPKTIAGHRTVVDGYIIPILGRRKLEALTPDDVRLLQRTMLSTPKDPALRSQATVPAGTPMLSSTYTLLAHNVLSGALKAAVREQKLMDNPCDRIDPPKKARAEMKALDVDQVMELLMRLRLHPQGALWATFLLTGARRGEVLGLEVERVTDVLDLSWQLQRITDISNAPVDWEHRHLRGTLYLSRPKNKAGWRVIPLVEPLKSFLDLHIGNRTEGLVFQFEGREWDPDTATKSWKRLLRDMGLPTDVVLHGSRHTVVDLLYAAGVPESVIMEIVGHSTRSVTRGYRTRANMPQLVAGMEALSKSLEATSE